MSKILSIAMLVLCAVPAFADEDKQPRFTRCPTGKQAAPKIPAEVLAKLAQKKAQDKIIKQNKTKK